MKQFYQEVVKGIDYLRTTPIYLILPQISPPFHHPRRQPAPRIQVHPSADHIQFLEMVDRISTHFNKINYNNNNTSTSTGYNFQTDETIASISRFVYLTPDFLGGKESRMFLRGLYSMSGHSLCDSCQLKTALNHASRALFMIKTTLE